MTKEETKELYLQSLIYNCHKIIIENNLKDDEIKEFLYLVDNLLLNATMLTTSEKLANIFLHNDCKVICDYKKQVYKIVNL